MKKTKKISKKKYKKYKALNKVVKAICSVEEEIVVDENDIGLFILNQHKNSNSYINPKEYSQSLKADITEAKAKIKAITDVLHSKNVGLDFDIDTDYTYFNGRPIRSRVIISAKQLNK